MVKKGKKKETGNVRKESKGNESKNKVDKKIKGNGTGFSLAIIIFSSLILGGSVVAYFVYKDVTHVPDLPEVDLNKWWGPGAFPSEDTSIRPYRVVFTEAMDAEIRWLFDVYRKSKKISSFKDSAWTYGINSEDFDKFFNYWIFKYIFRDRQKFFNQFDHFRTNIQGMDIHYIHVKPKVDKNVKVVPLLLLHGWPGSVREFYEAIPLLTTPRPGYDFVFEVIVPSLPGFGFSQAPARSGLSPFQIAIVMRNLMQRLGHKHYYVQGGDIGHIIGSHMATIFPQEVLGFHTNWPNNFSKYSNLCWVLGGIWPKLVANSTEIDKMYPLKDKMSYYLEESGYLHLQATKPDTIGIALQDSPPGLAAYILDKIMIFTDPANKFHPDGGLEKYYNYEKLLDNIMLYWISGSITTSMRVFKETFEDVELEKDLARIPTPVPTWGLRLKHDLLYTPDFALRWKYPNLVGTTNLDFGGHFAAFERPDEFSENVFMAVKEFRKLSK